MNRTARVMCGVVAGLLFAALRLDAQASCGPTFLHTRSFPADVQGPDSAATGDFTGDGLVDIAVTGGYIGVLPGDGTGSFGEPILSPFSNSSDRILAADLDGDGDLDIAAGDSSVTVFLGNGDGTFEYAGSYDGASNTTGFVVGYFNDDAILDLAESFSFYQNGLEILIGYGDGTFQAPIVYGDGDISPASLTVADFNEDGRSDLAAPLGIPGGGGDQVALYFPLPDGSLPDPVFVTVGSDPRGSMAGDVDGDGHADLVVARPDTLEVLYGNGNGTFDLPVAIPTGREVTPRFIVDVDGDGLADLVVSQISDIGNLSILFQGPPGTFLAPAGYQPAHIASAYAMGLFNGDARPDFVSTSYNDELVDVFLFQGPGLAAAPVVNVPFDPGRVAAGDFDGNGVDEIAGRHDFELLSVTGQDTDGLFRVLGTTPLVVSTSIQSIVAADFDSDDLDDLAVALDGYYTILLSNGNHTFSPGPPPPPAPITVGEIVAGDFDGDDLADLVLFPAFPGQGSIAFLRGNGDGSFQPAVIGPYLEHPAEGVVAVDLEGNSALDLVTANNGACCGYGSDTVSVLLGHGDGTFDAPNDYAAGPGASALATADFDGDAHPDIVTANSASTNVSILRGDGSGGLQPQVFIGIGWSPVSVVTADFNGDGFADIATADGGTGGNGSRNLVSLLLGDGQGAFQAPALCATSGRPLSIVAGQFDGLGAADAATSNESSFGGASVGFLLSTGLSVSDVFGPPLAAPGGSATFGVTASGSGPLQYQWRRDGVPLSDGLAISGAGTPTLTIHPVAFPDAGQYDVVVSDSCGSVTAGDHTLSVEFGDVPVSSPFHDDIRSIAIDGITSGCGGGNYCPTAGIRRDQMAVFLLKAKHGPGYAPPPCTGAFGDVPCPGGFADWIEQLAAEGVTSGCGAGVFCPNAPVTRAQMAVFLLKTKEGASFVPSPATGVFDDVPSGSFAADFIEELSGRGITGGCAAEPLRYCPNSAVLRQQIATFLVRTFQP
jgi:hypothetical protein